MSAPERVSGRHLDPSQPVDTARLALASRGDALTPYLFAALRRRFGAVQEIDAELTGLQRYGVAAATFRPRRGWVERFYKSGLAVRLRSRNVARVVRTLAPELDAVVQVHALFRLSGVPSALYVDCTHAQSAALWPAWNPLEGAALSSWYRRERLVYESAEHLFAFCETTRDSLIDDYGIDPSRVTVTGAGVNFSRLPDLEPDRIRPADRPPTILFVGHDFVRKGGMVLLEAFQRVREVIPEARLQLVGAGTKVDAQPGVEVFGRVDDRGRIEAFYRDADVFAMPSFFDPFPLVVLEAMSFALPVVATRQMGTPEMIDDGMTGRLVAPGSVDELAEALIELLGDRDEAAALGAAAREDVERRFTWDAVVERMLPALRRLATRAER
jgi:starch synthase